MHHGAILAIAMARHGHLGAAIDKRYDRSPKKHQRKHCGSEFEKSVHGFVCLLYGYYVLQACDVRHKNFSAQSQEEEHAPFQPELLRNQCVRPFPPRTG